MLLSMVASMTWFGLIMWLWFSPAPPMDLSQLYSQILVWTFVIMIFVPWLAQMNTEIRHEAGGHSWSTYGEEPKRKTSAYEDYREKLWTRTRRNR